MAYCPKCNRDYPENMKFCHECGSPLEIKDSEEKSEGVENKREKTKIGAQKTVLFLSLITVVVAFAMIVGVLLIVGIAAEKPNYSLYVRDGELVYVGVSRRDSIVLSDKFDGDALELYSDTLGKYTTVTRDRQYIIYPASFTYEGGFSLYVKSLNTPEKTDVKISSSVLHYDPSDDGDVIVYLETDGDLYRYSLKNENKEKLGTSVKAFAMSDNFKRVLYITFEGKLCVDGEELAEGVSEVNYYSRDFSLIAYSKSLELNVIVDFEENRELIDSYSEVRAFGNDGAFLYIDQADVDYVGGSGGYVEKVYYCDKTKNETVVERGYIERVAKDAPLAVVRAKAENENEYGYYLLCGTELVPFEMTGEYHYGSFLFGNGGKTLYYIDSYDGKNVNGDLWRAEITKSGELKSREKIDSDVSFDTLYEFNGNIVYYKNNTDSGGDLYIDGKLIDYEATVARIDPDENTVYYYTNKDSVSGTLKMYRGGRAEKISENVYDFDVSFGGEVFYLTNYDTLRDEGDLYLYRNEKSILIESGVSALVKVYNREE